MTTEYKCQACGNLATFLSLEAREQSPENDVEGYVLGKLQAWCEEHRPRAEKNSAKDWTTKAAEELTKNSLISAAGIRQTIVEHCPLEPGVAYMPVPRCDLCKHWTRGTIPVIKKPSRGGVCQNPELQAFAEGHQTLETAEGFGCVQWEAK